MSTLRNNSATNDAPDEGHPSFREALVYWLQLGCISFGGPAGQISIMHRGLVEQRRWMSEQHFMQATQFTMVLPGPEAQQLATYIGWRLHGVVGGLAAGGLFVLPSAILLYVLSILFVLGQEAAWMTAVVRGLNAAVIALILSAVFRIGGRTLATPGLWSLAAAAFGLIFFLDVSFIAIVIGAACIGFLGSVFLPRQFPVSSSHFIQSTGSASSPSVRLRALDPVSLRLSCVTLVACGFLWLLPTVMAGVSLGWDSTLARQGIFFSKAAIVTFGGAYAVLPYVAQQAVDTYGWLSSPQMMSGLALAETTPGPLIMVLQFVGFVGAWQHPDGFNPWIAASLGAALTTWVTFIPSFMFIFVGGPYVEKIEQWPRLASLLRGITAAVVGVMLNLGIRLALHSTQITEGKTDWIVVAMSIVCLTLLTRTKVAAPWLIVASGMVGWFAHWLGA
ncbi:MAG: chromate efflux transporter [Pirellula sp.]|nr:chromate efflux transporter [Pirellula sp.]